MKFFFDYQNSKKGSFIDLIALGDFPTGCSPSLQLLRELCELYLCMPVKLGKTFPLTSVNENAVFVNIPYNNSTKSTPIRSRMNQRRQLKTGDIFSAFEPYIKPAGKKKRFPFI